MEKNFYDRRAYESVDDGSPSWVLGLHLKNERKTKFLQLRVNFHNILLNYTKYEFIMTRYTLCCLIT